MAGLFVFGAGEGRGGWVGWWVGGGGIANWGDAECERRGEGVKRPGGSPVPRGWAWRAGCNRNHLAAALVGAVG